MRTYCGAQEPPLSALCWPKWEGKGRRRRGWQDDMVGWYHRLDGHEFEQALEIGDGWWSLVCCSPWGHKESDMTEQLSMHARVCIYSWLSKEFTCNVGGPGSIPGLGRVPGEGNSNPFLYSCLENPMDRGASQAIVHGILRVRHDLATKLSPSK